MPAGSGDEVPAEGSVGGRMFTLESNDDELIKVRDASARLSDTLGELIEVASAVDIIPLPEVDSKTLKTLIEYCDRHADDKSDTDEEKKELRKWDEAFVGELDKDRDALLDVVMASSYLNISGLLDITCQKVAGTLKGKTPEEMPAAFNIENDFTEEDLEEIRQENERAFQ
ncbi:SKP1-like protein 11 [Oryza brachyantha]|uniref:SKP1-like protein n=1 Tax=Oryza brachyantha TaxID=4533 RepID=J3MN54_ORYBR|nr:SKP1-like protein 11 [Oryza brachyantha]